MKKLSLAVLLILWCASTPLWCQAMRYGVAMDQDQVAVGEKVGLVLIALPGGSSAADFPEVLDCELIAGEKKVVLHAHKEPTPESASSTEPSARPQHYSFELPGVVQGQVVMSFADIDAPRLVFDVVAPEDGKAGPFDAVHSNLDVMSTVYEPFQKNASFYQPVYFLIGTDPKKSKFQISFKYRFVALDTRLAASYPWISGLHLGYTQTSFWDLQSDSAPFDDTSYKPELFWLSRNYLSSAHGLLRGVFLQGGYQHESNGRGGDLSRSTNFAYLEPILVFYDESSRFGLQVSPKIWSYVKNDDETNATLPDYRGYFDLGLRLSREDSFVLGSHFRWAAEGASLQLDFSYPLSQFFGDALDLYFYAQYTNALAESLIDYEERTQALRLGLALIR